MASSSRQKSTTEDALLRQRVKELEEEVSSCKKRLDDLRKAKNTTILKREREVLEVNAPKLGMRRDSDKPDPQTSTSTEAARGN
ncbi:hypothetical protein LSAT2_014127 [Lamellibrachia satsuma]|nr:hypothetical protein LSAT2_014127 [Lamellibrachia satsuma]